MRFKVDENLPAEIAAMFAAAGHDAVTVRDKLGIVEESRIRIQRG